MKILIDNGHGEDTPGKRSPDGRLREYLWNRQVAELVVEKLKERGWEASLLVPEAGDVSLGERVRRMNAECGREGNLNVLLVSIHVNAAGNGANWMSARGWSAYTCKGQTRSDLLAECLYDAAEREFAGMKIRKDMTDGDRDMEEDFYILKRSKCPAVLTENFFMDNREDCDFLLSDEGKRRCASAHVEGIISYLCMA